LSQVLLELEEVEVALDFFFDSVEEFFAITL